MDLDHEGKNQKFQAPSFYMALHVQTAVLAFISEKSLLSSSHANYWEKQQNVSNTNVHCTREYPGMY